jgi:hypothetical protein
LLCGFWHICTLNVLFGFFIFTHLATTIAFGICTQDGDGFSLKTLFYQTGTSLFKVSNRETQYVDYLKKRSNSSEKSDTILEMTNRFISAGIEKSKIF